MKQIAIKNCTFSINGMGANSEIYQHGKYLYRHITDINCQWNRTERSQYRVGMTKEEMLYAIINKYTHVKWNNGKWRIA